MPFFEDIGKKISNMGQTAVEKTKCSTETLRLNNQIREEQRLCKDLYQQIGQQYAQLYETNPDSSFFDLNLFLIRSNAFLGIVELFHQRFKSRVRVGFILLSKKPNVPQKPFA